MLQTRSVVTAQSLAEHFEVTERTIYRDIRTLENAGVPIGSEAGVGYFLEKGYHLPPVSFTIDEAASLLFGEKLLLSNLDGDSYADFQLALNKVRAVLDKTDKDYLSSLESDIEVSPTGYAFHAVQTLSDNYVAPDLARDSWLRECRSVLVRRQVVDIDYLAGASQDQVQRCIEPIGLFYYSAHWHLIGWCRLRNAYRDFRLDRISRFEPLPEQFARHSRYSLQEYLAQQQTAADLQRVEVLFSHDVVRLVDDSRYQHGFVFEESVPDGVHMVFMNGFAKHMARWLLQHTSGVSIIKGDAVRAEMSVLSAELVAHWNPRSSLN